MDELVNVPIIVLSCITSKS